MKAKQYYLLGAVFTLAFVLQGCGKSPELNNSKNNTPTGQSSAETVSSYTCPMHPHYISTDKDGSCPICGMDLVPVATNAAPGQTGVNGGKGELLYYKNPMGLPDTSPVPKKDSMGMDYIPVYSNEGSTGGVVVSPEMIQTMGIRTVPVSRSNFGGNIRAYGEVQPNTRLQSVSASRIEGWVENLAVRAEGDPVRRGQVLYRVYSPALIGAQKDYLASLQIGNERRIASVRQRLKSVGLQESSIKRLTETRELVERIPVYAESAGIVSHLSIREGDYVKPGSPIMQLQSYDEVWVIASVAESDLPSVKEGMGVDLRFESATDAPNEGQIDYIYPTIDPKTRTADVRIAVSNKSGSLRPGAYVDIAIKEGSNLDERLSVPTQAVLRDSTGAHVIAALGEGRFEPRTITIGASSNGRTEVTSGLSQGDIIVSSGQFMLDSEANLREGLAKLGAASPAYDSSTPLSELPIDAAALSRIDHLVDASLYFHEALIDGYPIDPYFLDPIIKIANSLESEFDGSKLAPIISDAKTAIQAAKTNKTGQQLAEHLAGLSTALDPWLTLGAPSHYKAKGLIFYSDPASGRTWLQEGGLPSNPYNSQGGNVITWPDPMSETDSTMSMGDQ